MGWLITSHGLSLLAGACLVAHAHADADKRLLVGSVGVAACLLAAVLAERTT